MTHPLNIADSTHASRGLSAIAELLVYTSMKFNEDSLIVSPMAYFLAFPFLAFSILWNFHSMHFSVFSFLAFFNPCNYANDSLHFPFLAFYIPCKKRHSPFLAISIPCIFSALSATLADLGVG